MPKQNKSVGNREKPDMSELITNLWITQLGLTGVPQRSIRAIVGCDMNRVTRIVRHLKIPKNRGSD